MNALPQSYQPKVIGHPLRLFGLASVEYSTGKLDTLWSKLTRSKPYAKDIGTDQLKVIIGLGNPGKKYEETRHNMGFMVIDDLRKRLSPESNRERFKSQIWESRIADERVILAKPQTFMNLSGDAVRQIQQWYKVPPEHLLVVYDDLDLDFGQLRMRERGSAGGHNGMTSVIQQVGTTEVPRLRIGIGRGKSQARAHVLSTFTPTERDQLPDIIDRAASGAMLWIQEGPIPAMNAINAKTETPPEQPAEESES